MAKVDLTLEIPDGMVQAIVVDFTDFHGWNPELGVPRPAYAKEQIIKFIKESVKTHRARRAIAMAKTQEIDETEIT